MLPDRAGLCGATSFHDGELTLRVRHRSRPGRRDVKAQPVVAGDVLPVEAEPDEGLAGPQLDVHRHRGGLGGIGPPGKVARDGELVAAVDTQGADTGPSLPSAVTDTCVGSLTSTSCAGGA